MIVTKEELIKIGFKEEQIFVINVPLTLVNNIILRAKSYKFDTLEQMKNDTLIRDIMACGVILICNTEHDSVFNEKGSYILRMYEFLN